LDSTNIKERIGKKKFIEKLNFLNENHKERGLLILLKNTNSTKIDNNKYYKKTIIKKKHTQTFKTIKSHKKKKEINDKNKLKIIFHFITI
jgi:hypothetical protein